MIFINRREEFNSFKNNYEIQMRKAINQIYIVEANHGVGKSEFIREVSKFFIHNSLNIYQPENNGELSIFKRFVLELDKASIEDKYDDFKTFYNKKINNTKAFQLLLKVTEIFGQTFIKSKKYDMDFLVSFRKKYIPEDMPLGKIIGKVKLVDCIKMSPEFKEMLLKENNEIYTKSSFQENYGWQVENVEVFNHPIPVKGQLSLWEYEVEEFNDKYSD